jgi:LAO/AO transport system kinase
VHQNTRQIPVFKTTASKSEGIEELAVYIKEHCKNPGIKKDMLVEKAWKLIQAKRMADINKKDLQLKISGASEKQNFNLYQFVEEYFKNS